MAATALPDADLILKAVESMPDDEYERLLCRAAALRRNEQRPAAERESELLARIGEGLRLEIAAQLKALREKMEHGELSKSEGETRAHLVAEIETHVAQRLCWLGELAGLRGQTVDEVAAALGLAPVPWD